MLPKERALSENEMGTVYLPPQALGFIFMNLVLMGMVPTYKTHIHCDTEQCRSNTHQAKVEKEEYVESHVDL